MVLQGEIHKYNSFWLSCCSFGAGFWRSNTTVDAAPPPEELVGYVNLASSKFVLTQFKQFKQTLKASRYGQEEALMSHL